MPSSARINQNQNQNQNQNMETEYNECPCCHQDWVADTDRNCPTCDLPVSEHVSVEVLCRRVREAQQRESALIVENQRLKALLEEKETFIERVITWPHDADPFTSPDHDNDSKIYS
jgi:predicted amidophosphoribosyltransferase